MPFFTILIEDTSPLLKFSPKWTPGTSADDPLLDKYSESSFMKSNVQGESMSFTFNGTGLTIVGAKRGNHGLYSVNLDGIDSPALNGSSPTDLMNQTLFSSVQLQRDTHSVVLTNEKQAFVDVDYVSIEVDIGEENEDLIVNSYQDANPIFSYTPASAWATTPDSVGSFSGSSGRYVLLKLYVNAISVLVYLTKIQGDGIAVYGPVGPQMATSYNVQIDNGPMTSFSANRVSYRAQQIIFMAVNLGPGSHLLSMTLGDSGRELAIDYANVFTTASLGGRCVIQVINRTWSSAHCFHDPATSQLGQVLRVPLIPRLRQHLQLPHHTFHIYPAV
ncbi:hypothetical protein BDN70DRAFT_943805 [Pholiota conissans]|uniref:Uncharacterized protein n=1 Tax=Pholiota conissans TaxID=109636 RepID=A0A9P5ZFB9_9AGAR|nr:hypothetical protein BDN70DRAFT_943805 [Pholiota conissans]